MKIEQLGEFGLIERIRAALPAPGPNVIVGIGDDVAVLKAATAVGAEGGAAASEDSAAASTDSVWLATCDVQVEGAHFLRDAIPPRSLGRKSLAINLSDIASAGGVPRYALVSLGLPGGLEVAFIDELYAGLREEGSEFGVDIVGGNISRSRLGIFIDVFLLGEAIRKNRRAALGRGGGRPHHGHGERRGRGSRSCTAARPGAGKRRRMRRTRTPRGRAATAPRRASGRAR